MKTQVINTGIRNIWRIYVQIFKEIAENQSGNWRHEIQTPTKQIILFETIRKICNQAKFRRCIIERKEMTTPKSTNKMKRSTKFQKEIKLERKMKVEIRSKILYTHVDFKSNASKGEKSENRNK